MPSTHSQIMSFAFTSMLLQMSAGGRRAGGSLIHGTEIGLCTSLVAAVAWSRVYLGYHGRRHKDGCTVTQNLHHVHACICTCMYEHKGSRVELPGVLLPNGTVCLSCRHCTDFGRDRSWCCGGRSMAPCGATRPDSQAAAAHPAAALANRAPPGRLIAGPAHCTGGFSCPLSWIVA